MRAIRQLLFAVNISIRVSFFLILTFGLSCSDDDATPKEIILTGDCTATKLNCSDYYPLNVGNYWIYSDNRKIEITGTKVIDGKTYYEFKQTQNPDLDTWYDRIENNKVYELFGSDPEVIWADFGSDPGYAWDRVSSAGNIVTTIETKTGEVVIGGTTFSDAIVYTFTFSDIPRNGTIVLLPGIGFSSQEVYNNGVPWESQTYSLRECKINGQVYLINQ